MSTRPNVRSGSSAAIARERNGYPVPVPEERIYREHGAGQGMTLACGHKADGIIRGSGGLYHCPTCRTAEESIYSVQARERHEASGWGSIFDRLRKRIESSPDRVIAELAELLVEYIAEDEGGGWNHGHRDANGVCSCSGEDCYDCDRLDRVRAWVEAHA